MNKQAISCGHMGTDGTSARYMDFVRGYWRCRLCGTHFENEKQPNEVARDLSDAHARIAELEAQLAALDVPETRDFAAGVVSEAAHQRKRWGVDHDAGKTDADWFWLLGYLAGKALHNPGDDPEKQLHRIITVAAAAANWHAAKLGLTNMRPGIDGAAIDGAGS